MNNENTDSIRLFLVRHGNTFEADQTPTQVGARSDLPLTVKGREQALQVASYLKANNIHPTAIYAGALKRQIESAEIINGQFNGQADVHLNQKALTEVDYGAWEGLTQKQIIDAWGSEYADWTEQGKWMPELFGETLENRMHELKDWLQHLRQNHAPGDTVVGLSSNGIIRYFYSFLKSEWAKLVQDRKIGSLQVKTGHLCELLVSKDGVKVVQWNANPKVD